MSADTRLDAAQGRMNQGSWYERGRAYARQMNAMLAGVVDEPEEPRFPDARLAREEFWRGYEDENAATADDANRGPE